MAGSFLARKSPSLSFYHVSFQQSKSEPPSCLMPRADPVIFQFSDVFEHTQMNTLSLLHTEFVSYSPPCNSRQQNFVISNSRLLCRDIQTAESSWYSAKWLYKVMLTARSCPLNLPVIPGWVSAFRVLATGAGSCKTGSEAFTWLHFKKGFTFLSLLETEYSCGF